MCSTARRHAWREAALQLHMHSKLYLVNNWGLSTTYFNSSLTSRSASPARTSTNWRPKTGPKFKHRYVPNQSFPCHGSTYNGHRQTHTHELRLQIRLKFMVREGSWIPERMRIIGHAYARTSASFQGASVTPRMENSHGCCVLTSSLRNKSLWHQFMGELSRTVNKW